MSENSNNTEGQEIDLSVISKKINNFFEGILISIFKGILFIKRNSVVFIGLIVIGFIGGYILDKTGKTYESKVIVTPNFGSTDYLYSKIDLLESKTLERDTVFLKGLGISDASNILSIKVEPIVDIYGFVNNKNGTAANAQNSQNFELVKLLSESGDINKVIKEELTSKNYPNHTITVMTRRFANNEKLIDPILSFLNTSKYYQSLQKSHYNNISIKMREDSIMINQSNEILNKISSAVDKNGQSDKLTFIYNNENTQFNDILTTKNSLISELGSLKIDLLNAEKIVKDFTRVLNIKNNSGISSKLKFILPLFLVVCFLGLSVLITFYKKQSAKMKNKL